MPRTRMESRRNTEKERKEDNMEQKKHEENEIPGVIASQESFQEPVEKRSKLVLPSPQISELEEGPCHIDLESSFQGAPRGGVASKEELKEEFTSLDKQIEILNIVQLPTETQMLEKQLKRKNTMVRKLIQDKIQVETEIKMLMQQIKHLEKKTEKQVRKVSTTLDEINTMERRLAEIRQLLNF